jgi:hypothetical protein
MKKDINFLSVTEPGTVIEDREIIVPSPAPGSYWSDAVHVNAPDVVIRRCLIDARNCEENAIDGNRAHNLLVEDCEIYAGKECALYLKGGASNTMFRRVLIKWAGGHSDFYAGDYSDQSHEWCHNNRAEDLARSDAEAVRVRWAWGDRPIITGNSNVKFQYCLSYLSRLYVGLKILFLKIIP